MTNQKGKSKPPIIGGQGVDNKITSNELGTPTGKPGKWQSGSPAQH